MKKNNVTNGTDLAARARQNLAPHNGNGTYVFIPTDITSGVAAYVSPPYVYIGTTSFMNYKMLGNLASWYAVYSTAYIMTLSDYTIIGMTTHTITPDVTTMTTEYYILPIWIWR